MPLYPVCRERSAAARRCACFSFNLSSRADRPNNTFPQIFPIFEEPHVVKWKTTHLWLQFLGIKNAFPLTLGFPVFINSTGLLCEKICPFLLVKFKKPPSLHLTWRYVIWAACQMLKVCTMLDRYWSRSRYSQNGQNKSKGQKRKQNLFSTSWKNYSIRKASRISSSYFLKPYSYTLNIRDDDKHIFLHMCIPKPNSLRNDIDPERMLISDRKYVQIRN